MRFITAELTCLSDNNFSHILQRTDKWQILQAFLQKTNEFRLWMVSSFLNHHIRKFVSASDCRLFIFETIL